MRSIDFCRVQMYWAIGRRISEKEQQGKERADYGKYIIRNLSKKIEPLYGSGFGVRQLERSRQFYRLYPIASTLRTQLNWSQYNLLISIQDPEKREYCELETVNEGLSGRQLERHINSMLYERLLLSNDKEAVLAVARNERVPESPQEIIKDPMVLEFLGLERKAAYYGISRAPSSRISPISFWRWGKDSPLSPDRSGFPEVLYTSTVQFLSFRMTSISWFTPSIGSTMSR